MLQDRLGQTPKIHVSGSCSRSYPYEWTAKVHAKLSAKLPYYTVGTYPLAGLFAGARIMAPRPPVSIPRPRARNMQVCRISLPTKVRQSFWLAHFGSFYAYIFSTFPSHRDGREGIQPWSILFNLDQAMCQSDVRCKTARPHPGIQTYTPKVRPKAARY